MNNNNNNSKNQPQKGGPAPKPPAAGGEDADPSMEDILASIRRILNDGDADTDTDDEDEVAPAMAAKPGAGTAVPPKVAETSPAAAPASAEKSAEEPEDILILDDAMMIAENEAPKADTTADNLVNPSTAAAASSSVGALKKALAERNTTVSKGGASLEDIIRDEFRPMLKGWLDIHLAGIVERLVRAEIERVVTRELT